MIVLFRIDEINREFSAGCNKRDADIAKSYATRRRPTVNNRVCESGESASREERRNSLPKVLSTADRLIHFRINRFGPARKPLRHPSDAIPFRLFLFGGWSRRLSHPPAFSSSPSTVPRRNKQLLSTFRSAKWEKAVGVQLATSLTGFARISTTEM